MDNEAQNVDDFDPSIVKIERAPTPVEEIDEEPLIRRPLTRKVKKTKRTEAQPSSSNEGIQGDGKDKPLIKIKEEPLIKIKEEPCSPVSNEQMFEIYAQELFQGAKARGLWDMPVIKTEIKEEPEENVGDDHDEMPSTSKQEKENSIITPGNPGMEEELGSFDDIDVGNNSVDPNGQDSYISNQQQSSELEQNSSLNGEESSFNVDLELEEASWIQFWSQFRRRSEKSMILRSKSKPRKSCCETTDDPKPSHSHKVSKAEPKLPKKRKQQKEKGKDGKSFDPLNCYFCKRGFKFYSQLEQHILIHNKERPFSCDKCKRRFKEPRNLDVHKKLVHQKLKPFKCQVCGKLFGQKRDLKSHSIIHSPEPPVPCPQCPNKFQDNYSLVRHIKTVHEGRRYNLRYLLNLHVKKSHN